MFLLRRPILALSGSASVRDLTTKLPITRDVVSRFVAGETTSEAVAAVAILRAGGLQVSLDHLGENTTSAERAEAIVQAYLEMISALVAVHEAAGSEVSVKLSAVGQALTGTSGHELALESAGRIADAAYAAGMRMNLDMEDHTTVDSTLDILHTLRRSHPDIAVVVQAMLKRTPDDLRRLVGPGSRVRLVKGAYQEPAEVAFIEPADVDLAYVRALRILMAGDGHPMIGSHDPRMIAIAQKLAADSGRPRDTYEFQMLYGIRPEEQRRLVAEGYAVRVYVPYGTDWYGYFTRRLAERPANLLFFLRAMASRS